VYLEVLFAVGKNTMEKTKKKNSLGRRLSRSTISFLYRYKSLNLGLETGLIGEQKKRSFRTRQVALSKVSALIQNFAGR
jgi:hypothetical protein